MKRGKSVGEGGELEVQEKTARDERLYKLEVDGVERISGDTANGRVSCPNRSRFS